MHDGGDGARAVGHARDAVHKAARFLAAGGRHLDDARGAARLVQHEKIRERSAHVHANHQTLRRAHADCSFRISLT
ncbi:hypothetical protein D3C85_1881360 [compost metagenome]